MLKRGSMARGAIVCLGAPVQDGQVWTADIRGMKSVTFHCFMLSRLHFMFSDLPVYFYFERAVLSVNILQWDMVD